MENRVEYWANRWEKGSSPWHMLNVNKFLERNFHLITQVKDGPCRIFVPLCGKTVDLKWMYDQGHHVVGVEGVEQPILEFFKDQGLNYTKKEDAGSIIYCTEDERLKIVQADLFSITPALVGKFDGVWDRGSLVAIYPEDRNQYASLLKSLLNEKSAYLLNSIEYDQSQFAGPPRSLPLELVQSLFGNDYLVELVEKDDTNADPSSPASAKSRWNLDVCHELILLLKPVS